MFLCLKPVLPPLSLPDCVLLRGFLSQALAMMQLNSQLSLLENLQHTLFSFLIIFSCPAVMHTGHHLHTADRDHCRSAFHCVVVHHFPPHGYL